MEYGLRVLLISDTYTITVWFTSFSEIGYSLYKVTKDGLQNNIV